jgi:hypothetical protein
MLLLSAAPRRLRLEGGTATFAVAQRILLSSGLEAAWTSDRPPIICSGTAEAGPRFVKFKALTS